MFIKNNKLKLLNYSTSIFVFLLLFISIYSVKKVNATCTASSDTLIKTTNPPPPDTCYNIGDGSWGYWHSDLGWYQKSPYPIPYPPYTISKCRVSTGSDYGYCYHSFHCDGPCSNVTPGETSPTPDPVYFGWIRGYIWSDDNKDNTQQIGEFWSGGDVSCLVDKTKIHDFTLDRHKYTDLDGIEDLILPDYWTCGTAPGMTTKVPIYTVWREFTQAPRWHGFRLLNSPTSVASWTYLSYFNSGQVGRDVKGSGSWAGNPNCSPTPECYEIALFGKEKNWLSFKMYGIPACVRGNTYSLIVKTYVDSQLTNSCYSGTVAPDGLKVTLCDENGNNCKYKNISSSTAMWSNISVDTYGGTVFASASGSITNGDVTDVYKSACPMSKLKTINATSCTTESINIGVMIVDREAWVSSIDGDVFADSVGVAVPTSADLHNAFSTYLVNADNGSANVGGYVFTQGDSLSVSKLFEPGYGGMAKVLKNDGKVHESKWLANFSFLPPNSSVVKTITTLPGTIDAGTVYQIKPSDFNSWMSSLPSSGYTYSTGSGVSVLYIGSEIDAENVDVGITKPILASPLPAETIYGRLVILSKPKMIVGKGVGFYNIANYQIDATPKIDASIIGTNVEFASETDTLPTGSDIPILLLAPLVSRGELDFRRDLGSYYNARVPAESALFRGKYLYDITALERKKSQTYSSYTGLTTFDIDFEYSY